MLAPSPALDQAALDVSLSSVLLQFRFRDKALTPALWHRPIVSIHKPQPGRYGRGTQFVDTTYNVGVRAFLFELDEDYDLVSAESRVDADPRGRREYDAYRVQYIFSRKDRNEVPQPATMHSLEQYFVPALKLLSRCSWIVRAYRNPHLINDSEYGMSINCENFGDTPKKAPQNLLRISDGRVIIDAP